VYRLRCHAVLVVGHRQDGRIDGRLVNGTP